MRDPLARAVAWVALFVAAMVGILAWEAFYVILQHAEFH